MRIGLQIQRFDWPGGPREIRRRLADIARVADEAGFYSLWVMDHLFQMPMIGPPEDFMLESYATLGYLAGVTERVRLGALVTGVTYRPPGLLLKSVTALDVLSGGRTYFGVGAGWYEEEARGLGLSFPPLKERFERLEETLEIAHRMFSGDARPYIGPHHKLAAPLNNPTPVSLPHPPILIGGGGENKTLRLVAEYGNACNVFMRLGSEGIRRKLDVLRRHCEEIGRDYDSIERTAVGSIHLGPGAAKPAEIVRLCEALAELNIDHVIFNMPNAHELSPLKTLGSEVIAAVTPL